MEHPQVKIFTSREFAHNVSAAKRAAAQGDHVIITKRGEPSYVLLSIDEYRRLKKTGKVSQTDEKNDFSPNLKTKSGG